MLRNGFVGLLGGAVLLLMCGLGLSGCGGSSVNLHAVKSRQPLRPLTPTQRREILPFVRATAPRCAAFTRWYARQSNGLYMGGIPAQRRAEDLKWNALFAESMLRERSLIDALERTQAPRFARRHIRALTRALRRELYVFTIEMRLDGEGRTDAIFTDAMVKMIESAHRGLRRTAALLGLKAREQL